MSDVPCGMVSLVHGLLDSSVLYNIFSYVLMNVSNMNMEVCLLTYEKSHNCI